MSLNEMRKPRGSKKRVLSAETIYQSFSSYPYGIRNVIKFDTPVNICEINILPPRKVLNSQDGRCIFGDTVPSKFPIKFFCNNLDENATSKTVKLGVLKYDENSCTTLKCNNNVWSNKLVSFGRYTSLTIIVYGISKDPNATVVRTQYPTNSITPTGPINLKSIFSFL